VCIYKKHPATLRPDRTPNGVVLNGIPEIVTVSLKQAGLSAKLFL
jgi:hypothetical protein